MSAKADPADDGATPSAATLATAPSEPLSRPATSSDAGLAPASGRLRRPSGEAPTVAPGAGWRRAIAGLAAIVLLGFAISLLLRAGILGSYGLSTMRTIADTAPRWLVDASGALDRLGGIAVIMGLRVVTAIVLVVYRRWRHLAAFLVCFVVADWAVVRLLGVERTPPAGIEPLTDRATFWFPSRPVAALAVTVTGMVFVLLPSGRARRRGIVAALVVSIAYAAARTILGADYPLDAGYSAALGLALPAALFAWAVPNEAFPVRYDRAGPTAHLDLGGDRGRAIVDAMATQLGSAVVEVEPFGLEGSGGSSPLRMRIEGTDEHLFAKIYSTNHLRADRWYRFGRTLLYGRLEDEVPFASVRRLVEYEDYALRLLDDVGVRVAHTYGVVELTPNLEYMVVTELISDARNVDHADVDDDVIEDGLHLIATLWQHGLAHRDIKPANLLVQRGHLQVVDVSGLEVCASRWRQLVDLANMMLVLALRSDPDRVYEHAARRFREEDIAAAFAAAVGMAVPTQLRARLEADPRQIRQRFSELAPDHPPIAIQRWSVRRSALMVGTALSVVGLIWMFLDALTAGLR